MDPHANSLWFSLSISLSVPFSLQVKRTNVEMQWSNSYHCRLLPAIQPHSFVLFLFLFFFYIHFLHISPFTVSKQWTLTHVYIFDGAMKRNRRRSKWKKRHANILRYAIKEYKALVCCCVQCYWRYQMCADHIKLIRSRFFACNFPTLPLPVKTENPHHTYTHTDTLYVRRTGYDQTIDLMTTETYANFNIGRRDTTPVEIDANGIVNMYHIAASRLGLRV